MWRPLKEIITNNYWEWSGTEAWRLQLWQVPLTPSVLTACLRSQGLRALQRERRAANITAPAPVCSQTRGLYWGLVTAQTIFTHLINPLRLMFLSKLVRDGCIIQMWRNCLLCEVEKKTTTKTQFVPGISAWADRLSFSSFYVGRRIEDLLKNGRMKWQILRSNTRMAMVKWWIFKLKTFLISEQFLLQIQSEYEGNYNDWCFLSFIYI